MLSAVKEDLANHFVPGAGAAEARDAGQQRFIAVPFTTVFEYLWYLRTIVEGLKPLGKSAMVYLAAAVSDFYVPESEMAEHKIQSAKAKGTRQDADMLLDDDQDDNSMVLKLRATPKVLSEIRRSWAPDCFLVSFKLETESEAFLYEKAQQAASKYDCDCVVANLLQEYKNWVTLLCSTPPSCPAPNRAHSVPVEYTEMRKVRVARPPSSDGCAARDRERNVEEVDLEVFIVAELLRLQNEALERAERVGMKRL